MSRKLRRAITAVALAVGTGFLPSTVRLASQSLPGWATSSADAYYGTSRRVARRTSRRTSYRQNMMYDNTYVPPVAAGAAGAVAGAAVVSSLPPGCSPYHPCGGVTYQPVYDGDALVYAPGP